MVDYPEEGSIFPPEIAPPTFVWRDSATDANSWRIDISFADGTAPLRTISSGPRMQIGEIDPDCIIDTNQPPRLTPQQASAHTWVPDSALWQSIKNHPTATLRFAGLRGMQEVSSGSVTIHTSKDEVGAPIFYRDVPLMPSQTQNGHHQTTRRGSSAADRLASSQHRRAAQPRGDGRTCRCARTAIPFPAMARPWGWIWTDCSTIAACTH